VRPEHRHERQATEFLVGERPFEQPDDFGEARVEVEFLGLAECLALPLRSSRATGSFVKLEMSSFSTAIGCSPHIIVPRMSRRRSPDQLPVTRGRLSGERQG
jgi:hypothetical protein